MAEGYVTQTQKDLSPLIRAPKLTDKLLSRPPFRFIHDIVNSFRKATGFPEGLYSSEMLDIANVDDRESRVEFLRRLIAAVENATGESSGASPTKIIAGQEAERTNRLLQLLAKCATVSPRARSKAIRAAAGGTTAAAGNDEVAAGGGSGAASVKTRKTEKESKPAAVETTPAPLNESEAEALAKRRAEKEERRRRREKEREKSQHTERDTAVERDEAKGTDNDKRNEREKDAGKLSNSESKSDSKEEHDERRRRHRREKEEEHRHHSSKPRQHDENHTTRIDGAADAARGDDSPRSRRPRESSTSTAAAAAAAVAVARKPPPRTKPTREVMLASGQTGAAAAVIREATDVVDEEESDRVAGRRVSRPGKGSAHGTGGADEDGSSAAAAAPPQDDNNSDWQRIAEQFETSADASYGLQGAAAVTSSDVKEGSAGRGLLARQALRAKQAHDEEAARRALAEEEALLAEEQQRGGIVIRSSKAVRAQTMGGLIVGEGELSKLREQLQMLTKASNPLGKFLEVIHDDIDSMTRELEMWRGEARNQAMAAADARRQTQESLEEIQAQLQNMDATMSDQLLKNSYIRRNVLVNDSSIEGMIRMIVSPEVTR